MKRFIVVLLSLMVAAFLPIMQCAAAPVAPTVYVAGDGSGDYTCDGTEDNVEINEALQYVKDNEEFTTVYLKGPFTYDIAASVVVGSNVTLTGDDSAVLKASAGVDIIKGANGATDITIHGFTLDGSALACNGIVLSAAAKNASVSNMSINNMGNGSAAKYGIWINKPFPAEPDNVKIFNNSFTECTFDSLDLFGINGLEVYGNNILGGSLRYPHGMRLYQVANVKIHDNVIRLQSAGYAGILLYNYMEKGVAVENIEIYNNEFINIRSAGIQAYAGRKEAGTNDKSLARGLHIHHNIFRNTGTNGSTAQAAGILVNGFDDTVIEHNVFDSCRGTAITAAVADSNYPAPLQPEPYLTTVRNNIFVNGIVHAKTGAGHAITNLLTETHAFSIDNNLVYNNAGADYVGVVPTSTIGADPLFADAANYDYHLKSKAGRWDGITWVVDDVHSPCIDAGVPISDFTNEPADNGGRVNIGLYGNTEFASKSVRQLEVSDPAVDGVLVGGTYQVKVAAAGEYLDPAASVYLQVDGTLVGTAAAAPYAFDWDTTTVVDGMHGLTAVGQLQQVGGPAYSLARPVKVDNTVPIVTLTDPGTDPIQGTYQIAASASDANGIKEVQFLQDGVLLSTVAAEPYSYDWDTTALVDGTYTITVRAVDNAENTAEATASVIVDNTVPTVTLTDPGTDPIQGTYQIAASASDANGIKEVQFLQDGVLLGTVTVEPYSYDWDTTAMTNGTYNLTARAVDKAGNIAESTAIVTVENPIFFIESPIDKAVVKGLVPINVKATGIGVITKVEFKVGEAVLGEVTEAPYTYTWDTAAVADDDYVITVNVTDDASKVTSQSITVTVDKKVPPIVYISGDGTGDYTCDGTADNVEINAAIQYVLSHDEFTTVYLKGPFTYDIAASVVVGNNVTLTGDDSAVLKASAGVDIIKGANGATDITIRGFTLDGSALACNGIVLSAAAKNASVSNMSINNMGNGSAAKYGIWINKPFPAEPDNVKIFNNRFTECTFDSLDLFGINGLEIYGNDILAGIVRYPTGMRLYQVANVKIYDNIIRMQSAGYPGIQLYNDSSSGVAIDNVEIYNNEFISIRSAGILAYSGRTDGGTNDKSLAKGLHIHHNIFRNTGTHATSAQASGVYLSGFDGTIIEHNIFDGCRGVAVTVGPMTAVPAQPEPYLTIVRNNIFVNGVAHGKSGAGHAITNLLTETHAFSIDNNLVYNNAGADYVGVVPTSTISADPLFADAANYDYHLKSKAGRWDDTTWVVDDVHSPCIDAGSPTSDFTNEPVDNGGRVNIGLYGNTQYASKSVRQLEVSDPAVDGAFVGGIYQVAVSAGEYLDTTASVDLLIDGTLVATAAAAPYTFDWDTSALVEGSYELSAVGQLQQVGGSAYSLVRSVIVDNTVPTVTLTDPGTDPIQGTYQIAASASDANGIKEVQFLQDGVLLGTVTVEPYSYDWDTTAMTNGTYNLTARAVDKAGNIAESTAIVTVENPIFVIESPTDKSVVKGLVPINVEATGIGVITKVEFKVGETVLGEVTEAPYTYTWDTTAVADDDYVITVNVTDDASKVTSQSVNVTVDNTAPAVSIADPGTDPVHGTYQIAVSASDTNGIKEVQFLLGEELLGTVGAEPYTYDWNTKSVVDGTYTITVRAVDNVGNTAEATASVVVDNATIYIEAPTDQSLIKGSVSITAVATGIGTIAKVEFKVGETVLGEVTEAPYTYTWDSTAVADGDHVITVDATDDVSIVTSKSITVKVDNTAPTLQITAPANGATVKDTVVISADASDSNGITSVSFKVGSLDVTDDAAPYSVNWDSRQVNNGDYTITVTATDAAGNATNASITVTTDNVFPTTDAIGHGPNPASSSVTFYFNGVSGTLRVYDISGRLVWSKPVPVSSSTMQIAWDLKNLAGKPLANGLYFYLVVDSDGKASKPLQLVIAR